MNIALLVARLVLATVFGAAGAAKVSGRDGTRATAAAFGVPAGLTGPVTLALPAAELLIVAALIPASSAAAAGWAALALLAVFSASVATTLARGRHPDCYCFGQFTASPIGWRTLGHVGVQRDREVALAYAYAGTPSAVVVSADGRIASRMAAGPDGVRALATALLARGSDPPEPPDGLRPGSSVTGPGPLGRAAAGAGAPASAPAGNPA